MIPKRSDPTRHAPQNAWILMGDAASYPTSRELAAMRADARRGVHENLWTAPINGVRGDLVLFYFTAPRKAVAFVARLASDPFWDASIEVSAENEVDARQWWAYTTSLIEIEPIGFGTLKAAHSGSLILKGRSGKFIAPEALARLTFTATEQRHQAELERVVNAPTGIADLPEPTSLTFEEWGQLASGALPLEAAVSTYVVEPMFRFLDGLWEWDLFRPALKPQYRVSSGYVDFVAMGAEPLLAVEVKLAIRRPTSGDWLDSPDFRQLRRYMDELDVPGILIDSKSVLLVRPGATRPETEFSRASATTDDLESIASLIYLAMNGKYGGTGAALANAAGPDPDEPKLYWVFVPGRRYPVIALRALSPESPALQAMAAINSPAFHEIALRFLSNDSCESVARDYLGGHLLDEHAFMTVVGGDTYEDLPTATHEFRNFVGIEAGAHFRQEVPGNFGRRVARRG